MKDLLTPAEKRAHGFRAVCNLTKHHPVKALPHFLRREYAEKGWPTGHRTVWTKDGYRTMECFLEPLCEGFETTDRTAFEDHMKTVHGKRNVHGHNSALVKAASGKWRTPKAPAEGKPYVPVKALTDSIVTCDCGLVMERDGRYASSLFIREHLELCAERAA